MPSLSISTFIAERSFLAAKWDVSTHVACSSSLLAP